MFDHLGPRATRLHLATVLLLALVGIGLLAVIAVGLLGPDAYSRDMALLGGVITAPVWLIGVVAGVDAWSVLRGRPVSRVRAGAWALLATGGAVVLAASFGLTALAGALLASPHLVGSEWPVIWISTPDGMGSQFLYADRPEFWAPLAVLPLGIASLVAVVLDVRGRPMGAARPPG